MDRARALKYLARPWTDPNSKRSSHGDSLFALDGVRGLAVLIVIASHTDAFGLRGQGSVGVMLFFALSGFVLALPYLGDPARIFSPAETARFFTNRGLRILPIFIVAVVEIRWQLGETWQWALQNLTFMFGWLHLWSVAEEARFYALFPLVIALLAVSGGAIWRMFLLAGAITVAWSVADRHTIDIMVGGALVPFYFWIFLAGIMAAQVYRWIDNPAIRACYGAAALLLLPLVFATSQPAFGSIWHPLFPIVPADFSLSGWACPEIWCAVFVVFLVGITTAPASIASRLMRSYPMRHLGLLSYSLYLFHVPVMFAWQSYGLQKEPLFAATLAASYAVAIITYLVIEKPFLMLKGIKAMWSQELTRR